MNKFKFKMILTCGTLVALLFILISSTIVYGWFSNRHNQARSIAFIAGEGDVPNMQAWIFDMINENTGEASNKDDGTWRSILISDLSDKYEPSYEIAALTENSNADSEKYIFTSLHLGTVDNLITLNRENYMFIRFDITNPSTQGGKAKFAYDFPAEGKYIRVYANDGTEVTGVDTTEFNDFLVMEYAISTTAYEPSSNYDAMIALFTEDNTAGYGKISAADEILEVSDNGDAFTDAYYLYLRLSPNLEKCILATESISIYMPCQLTYDINFYVEFYDIHA